MSRDKLGIGLLTPRLLQPISIVKHATNEEDRTMVSDLSPMPRCNAPPNTPFVTEPNGTDYVGDDQNQLHSLDPHSKEFKPVNTDPLLPILHSRKKHNGRTKSSISLSIPSSMSDT
ncbi:MAG: hypothetical protein Sylvanvirus6_37 [Sylvanvirus sp.]|uniref:Uncharacterized protein n=1 Tax=Sylvanvirus sp. TaxID=2487774 RepID=A0A3G5AHR0_9VIRU|nr:MAG: hypothetical protein Sylvanvirus6_37 [Sylvanvirus sp.]